ncbi:MAG TPA: DNA topoisomerase IB [Gryllotalpicola sp.]
MTSTALASSETVAPEAVAPTPPASTPLSRAARGTGDGGPARLVPRRVRIRRSDPSQPGITRVSVDPPRYRDHTGQAVEDPEVLERIRALAIPPAWTEVWISPPPNGHIQALGTDAAGRRQYLYHAEWRRQRDGLKFDRMLALAHALPTARRTVTRELGGTGLSRERALAAAFRLTDRTALRIGGERYRQLYGSRGLTTLLGRHAELDGDTVRLSFPAKGGLRWESEFRDGLLAAYLSEARAARGLRGRLLVWRDRRWHALRPQEVNEDIRARTGVEASAKDFRTLRGTIVAARALARSGPAGTKRERTAAERRAVEAAAAALGNTPAVARSSYIDPRVFDRYRDGELIAPNRSPERALVELLG